MIDCKEAAAKLFEYLDKELCENDKLDIESHLKMCRPCFDAKEFEALLRDHMKEKTEHRCPDKVKKKIKDILDQY